MTSALPRPVAPKARNAPETPTVPHALKVLKVRLPILLSLAALLLLAVLATRGGSAVPHGNGLVVRGGGDNGRITSFGPAGGHVPTKLNTMVTAGLSSVLAIVLVAYLVAAVMVVVALASLRWRRARKLLLRGAPAEDLSDGRDATTAVVLLRGARAALVRLRQRAGGPPSDAVQQAWLVLEEAAAEGGTARRPDQTSTEFTGAVLTEHDVDPAALATLRALYQRARFGHPDMVTEADAEAAIDALDRIADILTVRARPTDASSTRPTEAGSTRPSKAGSTRSTAAGPTHASPTRPPDAGPTRPTEAGPRGAGTDPVVDRRR
ncbi:MAG TPA: DUF4129 domain-containing protein [Pseudonocardiaceae bacterium]|nr:DUF4129 domain-containing protein [Pseudonocardiaceae bacterium]